MPDAVSSLLQSAGISGDAAGQHQPDFHLSLAADGDGVRLYGFEVQTLKVTVNRHAPPAKLFVGFFCGRTAAHYPSVLLLLPEVAELRAIAQGLSAIAPAKALWKLSDSDLVMLGNSTLTLGSNVKTVKWAPQNDVLGHPNVKAFYTQGGANSFNE